MLKEKLRSTIDLIGIVNITNPQNITDKEHIDAVLDLLDHKDINTLPEFDGISPSSEMLSKFIYEKLKSKISCISKVSVWETEKACASYYEE